MHCRQVLWFLKIEVKLKFVRMWAKIKWFDLVGFFN